MVADYVAELGRLSKTCKFGDYLETALVCGSNDIKTQKELLCVKGLTLTVTINKARAAETVNREVQHFPTNVEALKISSQQYPCPRCVNKGIPEPPAITTISVTESVINWAMQVQFAGKTSHKN